MKKIFMVIALMAMLMLPLTSFSMTAMEEGDLSSVTGQSGVSINLDLNLDIHADVIAWGDRDGVVGGDEIGGWVGLSNLNVNGIQVGLRKDLAGIGWIKQNQATYNVQALGAAFAAMTGQTAAYAANPTGYWAGVEEVAMDPTSGLGATFYQNVVAGTFGTEVQAVYKSYNMTQLQVDALLATIKPLTIDVATGGDHPDVTYVRIGTGSIGVNVKSLTTDINLGTDKALTEASGADTLGQLFIGNLALNFAGTSRIDIYNGRTGASDAAQNVTGITLDLDVHIDSLAIGTLAWGDDDGFNNSNSAENPLDTVGNVGDAGWIGLKGINITNLIIDGEVAIDVGTATSPKNTYVNIGFGTGLNVSMDALTADVNVGPEQALTAASGAFNLGSLYLSALDVTLTGDVQIYANNGTDGVNIELVALQVDMADFTLAWGDKDGATTTPTDAAGWVGLRDISIDELVLSGVVTIDVATNAANRTYVNIGMTNVQATLQSLSADVALGSDGTLTTRAAGTNGPTDAGATAQTLGVVFVGGVTGAPTTISISDGSIQIMAHDGTTGVELNLDALTINFSQALTASWGDLDGMGADGPGYVGLNNLTIDTLTIDGLVSIDVATVNDNPVMNSNEYSYTLYAAHGLSTSFVHLAFGDGTITYGNPTIQYDVDGMATGITPGALGITAVSIAANAVLSNSKDLSGNMQTLGQLWIGNLMVGVNGWVDIAAH